MSNNDDMIGKLLTVKQVAEISQVSERHVRRLIKKGQLPYIRFGRNIRIASKDLERFIAANRFD